MAKSYKVKGRFSTVVVLDGANKQISFEQGQEIRLDDDLVALIDKELPGYLVEVPETPVAPKVKTAVVTAPAPDGGATRGVVKAPKPKKSKK